MLRKEVDKLEIAQYIGIECDSDEEMNEDESDAEYFSDDEARKTIDYDLEKMFEIIKKKDFSNWSYSTIHHHYRKIDEGPNGRKQISR